MVCGTNAAKQIQNPRKRSGEQTAAASHGRTNFFWLREKGANLQHTHTQLQRQGERDREPTAGAVFELNAIHCPSRRSTVNFPPLCERCRTVSPTTSLRPRARPTCYSTSFITLTPIHSDHTGITIICRRDACLKVIDGCVLPAVDAETQRESDRNGRYRTGAEGGSKPLVPFFPVKFPRRHQSRA